MISCLFAHVCLFILLIISVFFLYSDVCIPSNNANTCIVVNAAMTFAFNNSTLDEVEFEALSVIKNAMETDIFISDSTDYLIKLTYLEPNLDMEAMISDFQKTEESKKRSNPPIVFGLVGVLPAVVGLLAFLLIRKKNRQEPKFKRGYLFHPDETEVASRKKRGVPNLSLHKDELTDSSNHSGVEGEFIDSIPFQLKHILEREVGVEDVDVPPPPTNCHLSPATQETVRITNTTASAEKRNVRHKENKISRFEV